MTSPNYSASTSNAVSEAVNRASTTTVLTSSLTPSTYGSSVTFMATISPGVPVGETVTFCDGAAPIGTGTTAGGSATFTTTALAAGAHSITASYPGDASYLSSVSSALAQTVNQASTTTSLSSSPNSAAYGISVTFTATVSPSVPNGEVVTFNDGGAPIGTGPLSGGIAIFATSRLSAGVHDITASYPGDANYQPSASSMLPQDIVPAQTTISIVSSLNPSVYGASLTFTATIFPAVPNGDTMTFLDAGSPIGSGPITGGIATYTTSALTASSHSIAAGYPGHTNYAGSMSSALTQTVNTVPTTTTLSSTPTSSVYGDAVTITASVSPAVPVGETVTFYDGGVSIGTSTTSGNSAAFTTIVLAVGSHSITASYPGDGNFQASTSSALTQTVTKVDTATALTSSLNPSTCSASVTFTATVSPGATDGTTVNFMYSGTTIVIGSGTTSGGVATCETSTLQAGSWNIVAQFGGDISYGPSTSSALTQIVNKLTTTTTLAPSLNPSAYLVSVTFTATISPAVPDGETVTFYDGSNVVGTGTTSESIVTCTTSALSAGIHAITASYPGDANYSASTSSALSETVNQEPTVTALTASLNPSAFGASVTFTATVLGPIPDGGTMTFYDGGTSLGTSTMTGAVATIATSALAVGSHSITASYSGDTNYAGSTSTALMQGVNKDAANIILVSGLNPSTLGATVIFTATLNAAIPDGETVTFYDLYGYYTYLGTSKTVGATATIASAALAIGSHSITASYSGDATFDACTSSALTQTVNKTPSTTTLTSNLNPAAYGASVTFTATVSPAVSNGEIVTFYDGGVSIGAGMTTLGGVATLTVTTLAEGSHAITAGYPGDEYNAASTSIALTQIVDTTTTTTLTSSINPSTYGTSVTFTATISPPVPDGEKVGFSNGDFPIGTASTSSGRAIFTTKYLAAGQSAISARYPGDANYTDSASTLTQTVSKVATSMSLVSSLNPAECGASVTFTATVSPAVPNGETMTFYNGATSLGIGTIAGGSATLTTTTLPADSASITASYAGDANYLPSTSPALAQTVSKAATTTTLASSLNPSNYEAPVTFTATISPAVPAGETVSFYDGSAAIGAGTTTRIYFGQGSISSATLMTSSLALGNHSITASYAGDATYAQNTSAVLTQIVTGGATTATTVASSLNPSTLGTSVTFAATVSPSVTDGETVTFYDGSVLLGTGSTANGIATLVTTALAAATHNITATYAGDSTFASSTSSVLAQVVNLGTTTTTTLYSSLNPSTVGEEVMFTATISPAVPDGETVTLYDGLTSLGWGTTRQSRVTLATSFLIAGSHIITATYAGDATFASSTSSVLTQVVQQQGGTQLPSTTTTLAFSQGPTGFTFTATVSPHVSDGETVTFYNGSTSLGTGTTSGSIATLTPPVTFAAFPDIITAAYTGDATYAGSTSNAITFNAAVLSPSPSPPCCYGDLITFKATISPSVPDGTAVFLNDSFNTALNDFTNGTSCLLETATTTNSATTFMPPTLAVGSHVITATYAVNGTNSQTTWNSITQTVNPCVTALTVDSPVIQITAGTSTSASVNIYFTGTLQGNIALGLSTTGSTLPTYWFYPANPVITQTQVTSGALSSGTTLSRASSTLYFDSVPSGTYPLTVTATATDNGVTVLNVQANVTLTAN